MHNKRFKRSSIFVTFVIFLMSTINVMFMNNVGYATDVSLEEAAKNGLLDNLTAGYDVTGSQEMYDSGFKRSNPILRPMKDGLYKHLSLIDNGLKSTEAVSSVEYSELEAIKNTKKAIGGGINVNVAVASIDLNVAFEKDVGMTNKRKERFETFFQKNQKLAYVLTGDYDYRDYLTQEFENDIHAVTSEADANKLFDKYGTHLCTGLVFGGLLQVCNYQVTSEASKKFTKDKKIQGYIDMCMGFVEGEIPFDFKESIENEENKNNSRSTYKCHLYGGMFIPAVTMDHLFTYNPSIVGNGNYMYGRWTDSLNNMENLVPLGLYPDSKAYPVWDLLPSNGEFNKTRNIILNAYKKRCGDRYDEFLKKFPEAERKEQVANKEDGVVEISGYAMTKNKNTSYYEYDSNHAANLYTYKDADIVVNSMDTIPVENRKWKVIDGDNIVKVVDANEGIFKVNDNATIGQKFIVGLCNNEKIIKSLEFTINDYEFSGGLGTEQDPYKIDNKLDFDKLVRESGHWNDHFILTRDIDLDGEAVTPIGKKDTKFGGCFDGNNFTIYNFTINTPVDNSLGLFAYNTGTIKNLNIGNQTTPITISAVEEQTTPNVFSIDYAGSLVGYNDGSIINCHAENIDFEVHDYYDVANDQLTVGGLVGFTTAKNNVESRINQCSAQINKVIGSSYYLDKQYIGTSIVTVGGFVGKAEKARIDNCILQKSSAVYARAWSEKQDISLGGFIGETTKEAIIENCVLGEITHIGHGTEHVDYPDYFKLNKNLFVGKANANHNFINCTAKTYKDDTFITGVEHGCTIQTILNIKNCNLSTTSWSEGKDYPLLNSQTMDVNSPIFVDISKAKKDYYYGETLNIAGIKIQGVKANGDTYDIPYFYVDVTSYDPNLLGNQTIKVNVAGKTVTYHVNVNKIKIVGITAQSNKADFHSNEKIQKQDIDTYLVLENGKKVLYSEKIDSTIEYPEDKTITVYYDDLVLGDNIIYIDFANKFTTETICHVYRDELLQLTIEKLPNKLSYKVGESFSTNGMQVKAKYKSGYTKILNNDELEIFGDNIVEGTNKVQISYDNYTTVEQEVEGIMPTYTVKFEDANGKVFEVQTYEKGELIVAPEGPVKDKDLKYTYTFDKWDKEVGKCNSDMTFKPLYTKELIKYTISFVDDKNNVIEEHEYTYGEAVLEPKIPLKPSDENYTYTFEKWDKTITPCDGHKTYKAIFTATPIEHPEVIVPDDNTNNGNGTNLGLAIGLPVGAVVLIGLGIVIYLKAKGKL